MHRFSARPISLALVAICFGGLQQTARAQPSLTHVTPGAVAPGATTDVMLHGSKLGGALRVWTSFPAQVELPAGEDKPADKKQAVYKLKLSPGVAVGIGGIAVANADGLSDVVYLMIDDLPSGADNGNNHAAAQAQEISLPVGIDGQCDGTLSDYYRFEARAGERVSGEVVAARLGWDFDSLVRVLDASGNELALYDDDPSTGADSRFVFTAPATERYTIELRDNRYKPGGRYRLRLGDFPLVSTPNPLVVQCGLPTEIGFRSPTGEIAAAATAFPLGESGPRGAIALGVKPGDRRGSGYATLGTTDLQIFAQPPSGGGANNPKSVSLPCVVGGTLLAAGQRDLFQFQATKGPPLRFRAMSRSLGSPAIIALRVRDVAGKQLVESPVTESDEPALNFNPPADGTYQLAVEELAGRGGSDFTYAVECKSGPQLSLLLKNDKNSKLRHSLPSGGAFYLDVQTQRAGYDGPITLSVDSDRSGWQVANNTIPAKANEVRLYVVPPLDLAVGEITEIRVIGRVESSNREIVAAMSTTVQLRAGRPQTPYPPAWHDGAIFVSRLSPKPGFYAISNSRNSVELSRAAGQAQLTLDFERTDPKFKDVPLNIVPFGLPAGVTAEIKRNGNGPKETYDVILKGSKDLVDGEHMFRYFAFAEMAGQGRGVLSGDIRLNIVPGEMQSTREAKTP